MSSSVLSQMQELEEEMRGIKQRMQTLYCAYLSEEATRYTGVELICTEISETMISYGKRVRQLVFEDDAGMVQAKLVEYYFSEDDDYETVECFALQMSHSDARDFLMDMKYTVDWSYFK